MVEDLIIEEKEEEQTTTIYQRRIDAYKDKREKVLSGGLNCIPSPFHRFRKEFPGIERGKYYLLSGSEKAAKCFGKNIPIRMFDGSVKMSQDIRIGDELMGNDSTKRKVISTHRGVSQMYKIIQNNDGIEFTVNGEHILYLYRQHKYFKMSVNKYLQQSESFRSECMQIQADAIEYPLETLPIDPYFYGLWLGDGDTKEISITNQDEEIISYLYEYADKIGCKITPVGSKNNKLNKQIRFLYSTDTLLQGIDIDTEKIYYYRTTKEAANHITNVDAYISRATKSNKTVCNCKWSWVRRKGHYRKIFKEITGFQKERINPIYLKGSKGDRFALLAGLVDSDGTYNNIDTKNGYTIVSKYITLAKDIQQLAWSLGLRSNISKKYVKKYNKYYYNISFSGDNCEYLPIKVNRKKYRKHNNSRKIHRNFEIEPIGKESYYGFETDGNHLFLLEDYTIVHNSQISDYLFVLQPILYAYYNPDKVRIKILYFSLEMSIADKLDQWVCFFLYYFSKGRIRIDTKYLNSLDENNPLSEEIIEILGSEEYKSIFNFIEKNVIIDENTSNPYGIYKACTQLANERGIAHKKTVKWRDEVTGIEEDKEVLDYFEPNDPDEYWICLTDHLSLITPERGMNLRETIGKFSSKDCVKLRNIYGFSIVNIQQQAADREGNESIKLNRLTPSTDGLGENKTTARDASLMFGIFSPWRHERPSWLGYDIAVFQDNIRFLEIVRNRNGRTGAVCPLYFDGAVNFFAELPHSDDEKITSYKQLAQKAQNY